MYIPASAQKWGRWHNSGSPIEIRGVLVLQSGQGGGRSESKPKSGTNSDSMGTKLVPLRFLSSKTMKIPPQKSPETRKS